MSSKSLKTGDVVGGHSSPVQRKILLLMLVFFVAFLLIVGAEGILRSQTKKHHDTLINQHARADLGKVVQQKLLMVEIKSNVFLTADGQRDFDLDYRLIKEALQEMDLVLTVLHSGGSYEDILPTNFGDKDIISNLLTYHRKPGSGYVIEILDLRPRLLGINELVDDLYAAHEGKLRNVGALEQQEKQLEISTLFKKLHSELLRSRENANKIVYDTNQAIRAAESEHHRYEHVIVPVFYGFLISVCFVVALLTARIFSQVGVINQERETLLQKLKMEISEREAADLRVQKALETTQIILQNTPFGFFVVGKDRRIRQINKTALEILGFDLEDEVVGQTCQSALCPAGIKECPLLWEMPKALNSETTFVRRDKRKIPVLKSSIPIEIDGEELLLEGFIDISERKEAQDITRRYQERLEQEIAKRSQKLREQNFKLNEEIEEHKRTENELVQTQTQLLQAEKMASIGQLAAGVAHEINNPVGFITSNLATLKEYGDDMIDLIKKYLELEVLLEASGADVGEQVRAELKIMKEEMDLGYVLEDMGKALSESQEGTDRVSKIVLNLKSFSHVDETFAQAVDLNEGLDSTLSVAWNEIKYKAEVTKDFGDIPPVVCYGQQINQVFLNILVNAAQAIKKKGEISLRTSCDDEMVYIAISDTGQGIEPHNIQKLFDPFFTTKDVGKGTGLGLSLSYNIIQIHNGNIDVESEVGKGTTFTISLPIAGNLAPLETV
ncbi:MAG: PAS domain-containing protein [Gemmatimonadales bacterium]|nr:PAS domain-containing protein [Gemmatimonadales bacterium]